MGDVKNNTDITMVCGTETSLVVLKSIRMMELGSNYLIKNNLTMLQGHFGASNSTSYSRFQHIELSSEPSEIERWNNIIVVSQEISELRAEILQPNKHVDANIAGVRNKLSAADLPRQQDLNDMEAKLV
uniref:Uncharacterized protein n=1 Tax=Glossina palpalis gambiensis TaxID=67801 RepID=A0A1B0BM75_9MUSC